MVDPGIEFKLIWYDQDVVEYLFKCSNGRFSGQAEAYLGYDQIPNLVKGLEGFPSGSPDCREFELGNFDPKCGGGGMRLRFIQLDSAGHSVVDLELRDDGRRSLKHPEFVAMRMPILAAAIDSFVVETAAIGLKVGAKSFLRMSS
ncbi:MAG TPA: hypothetical protein VFA90_02635 [Terriglobales bacterium]|nr:hypothetical protein [Terriglobales bacterium]